MNITGVMPHKMEAPATSATWIAIFLLLLFSFLDQIGKAILKNRCIRCSSHSTARSINVQWKVNPTVLNNYF